MKYILYLLTFILRNRRSGTTTLIKKIASEHDCYIVVRYSEDIKKNYRDMQEKCMTLDQLHNTDGLPSKPILFETNAIQYVLELAKERLEVVSHQNYRRDALLGEIKDRIDAFDRRTVDKIGSVIYSGNPN